MSTERWRFDCACNGFLSAIERACQDDWFPYTGKTEDEVRQWARLVMRRARKLGLYPTTEQLEADLTAWLVNANRWDAA